VQAELLKQLPIKVYSGQIAVRALKLLAAREAGVSVKELVTGKREALLSSSSSSSSSSSMSSSSRPSSSSSSSSSQSSSSISSEIDDSKLRAYGSLAQLAYRLEQRTNKRKK
jgi:peptidoglycan DL-endopeptidase CwlO